jgi:hypothetical protein
MRRVLDDESVFEFEMEKTAEMAKIHFVQRMIKQLKNDLNEYELLMCSERIIPFLKHSNGTDLTLIEEDGSITELDIKSSRFPSSFHIDEKKPEDSIRTMYEKQGEDWFSAKPRLYLISMPEGKKRPKPIFEQLIDKKDISFFYNKHNKTYSVKGARIVFL